MYKSILAISEGGPDAGMSFDLAVRLAALFGATVDAAKSLLLVTAPPASNEPEVSL